MDKVFDYIDRHQNMYIEWLQEACRQPSVSAHKRGVLEMAELVARFLRDIGAQTEIVQTSGNPIVYGEFQYNKPKTLTFYNHYDVQPEEPLDQWLSDPFGAEIRDGKLYARGVADNKGNLMARICAIHAYLQVHGELPTNIKFIVDGEEEIGSVNTHEIAEKYPEKIRTDAFIWESGYRNTDGSLQVRLGVKGMLYVELIARGAKTDLHSMNAAIVVNPAWRLVWALSTLKNSDEFVMINGFYDRVQKPNAAEREILRDMPFDEHQFLESNGLSQYLLNLTGTDLKERLIFQPTCTICGLSAGYTGPGSKTVLPAEARSKLDFRLVADQDPDEILASLRKHLDQHGFEDIEIHKYSGKQAAKTNPEEPVVQAVIRVAERLTGKKPQILITTPGTGPMYNLAQKYGIPAVGFGVGYYDSRIHAPNENIRITDYVDGMKMVVSVIEEFSKIEGGLKK